MDKRIAEEASPTYDCLVCHMCDGRGRVKHIVRSDLGLLFGQDQVCPVCNGRGSVSVIKEP